MVYFCFLNISCPYPQFLWMYDPQGNVRKQIQVVYDKMMNEVSGLHITFDSDDYV